MAGSGINIGGAMIAITICTTVGPFMSQSLIYVFATRLNVVIFHSDPDPGLSQYPRCWHSHHCYVVPWCICFVRDELLLLILV